MMCCARAAAAPSWLLLKLRRLPTKDNRSELKASQHEFTVKDLLQEQLETNLCLGQDIKTEFIAGQ
jgi:hypothetical protein